MSYRKLVENQVEAAFKLLGDLKDNFTFFKESKNFNKITLENELTIISSKEVAGVLVDRFNKKGYTAELYIPVTALDEPSLFDSVTGLNRSWKIVSPFKNDGYLYTIKLQEYN
jgi:hypothetical protein